MNLITANSGAHVTKSVCDPAKISARCACDLSSSPILYPKYATAPFPIAFSFYCTKNNDEVAAVQAEAFPKSTQRMTN